jgi:hypothetical protein
MAASVIITVHSEVIARGAETRAAAEIPPAEATAARVTANTSVENLHLHFHTSPLKDIINF